MTYLEHTSFVKQKSAKKHPAFKDKSGNIKKVVIVRRKLMRNFICTTIFRKFWCIYYDIVDPIVRSTKKTIVFF